MLYLQGMVIMMFQLSGFYFIGARQVVAVG